MSKNVCSARLIVNLIHFLKRKYLFTFRFTLAYSKDFSFPVSITCPVVLSEITQQTLV